MPAGRAWRSSTSHGAGASRSPGWACWQMPAPASASSLSLAAPRWAPLLAYSFQLSVSGGCLLFLGLHRCIVFTKQ